MIKETLRFATERKTFHLFICVYILISLIGMYFTPLFDEDEGFFAEASRQMLATGDYVTINVNGEERYDKPALFFWINALSLKLFGINEFTVRLPSFIFFILTLILLYNFSKKYYQTSNAYISVVIMTSIVQFQVLARASVSDNLLNLLVAAALFSFYHFFEKSKISSLFWLYTFAGLGFLTKGPLAFVVIFGVILFFLILSKNLVLLLKILNPIFILWSVIIPFPWFYLAYLKSGDFLFTDFFIKHNLSRFSQTMESHGGYWWYYFPVIILSFIPFAHLLFPSFKSLKFNDKNIFLLTWFLLPFVLFSFSKTQLPHYISIGYIPLIILISQSKNLNFNAIYLQISLVILLFLIAPTLVKHLDIKDENVNQMLKKSNLIFDSNYIWTMMLLFVLANILYFLKKQYILGSLVLFSLAVSIFIYKYGLLQQGFIKQTGLKLRNSKQEIFMKDHYNPSLSFYAKRVFSIKQNFEKGDIVLSRFPVENTDSTLASGSGFILLEK